MSDLLRCQGLGVRLGNTRILSDVGLRVVPGELVAVIGPNGAGKSTLLGALSGEIRPDAGTVEMQGTPIGNLSPRELALRRAVLPQTSSLLFHFSAFEVVRLGLASAGTPVGIGDMIETAMDQVGVLHLRDRLVPTLSGGERQRVHLARCLVQLAASPRIGAKLLMLDEPTASLDPAHQHRVMRIARRFAEAGNGAIAVVHDLNLAAAYADRLIVLADGRSVYDGPVEGGLTADRLADVFDLETEIVTHPRTGRPTIIELGPTA